LEKRRSVAVPQQAVLLRRRGEIIFLLKKERVLAVPVVTGLRSEGFVEIRTGAVGVGDRVVVRGQDSLNDGDRVRIGKAVPGGKPKLRKRVEGKK